MLAPFPRGWDLFLGGVFGVLGISSQAIGSFRNMLMRIFVFAVLLRLIVPMFISLSFTLSQLFLQPEIERNKQQLSVLEEYISAINPALPRPQELVLVQQEKISQLEVLRNTKLIKQDQLGEVRSRIGELENEMGLKGLLCQILNGNPDCNKIKVLREGRDGLEKEIETLDDQIVAEQDELRCIERQIAGKSCESWLGKLASAGKKSVERLSAIPEAVDRSMTAVALILAAVLAKNVLFPVVFLIVAVKLSMPIARSVCRLKVSTRSELDSLGRTNNQVDRASGRK